MELGLLYTSYFSLEWRFSYKKMEIAVFHMKHWKHLYSLFAYVSTCLKHLCAYPHELVAHVCVIFCVDCVQPQLTEMNVTDREIWSKQKAAPGIHRVWETGPCISEVVLFKTGMRKEWPVTTQNSVFTNLALHQET
uniref:Uncharacterized protein n=1 Tax=Bos taurus TaxID=9913 RepID=A0ABI0NM17_BOVIN